MPKSQNLKPCSLEKYETADLDKLVKEIFVRQEPFNMAFAGAMRNLNLGAAHIAPGDVNQRAAQAAAQPYADVLYGNGAAHVLNQTEERERVIRLCMAALPVPASSSALRPTQRAQ